MNRVNQAVFGTSDTANPAPTQNAEAKELSLVGKVELRIALADSDSKLESILNTYLPPLLLKLTSDHSSVRNKVSLENQNGAFDEMNKFNIGCLQVTTGVVPRSFLAANNIFFLIGYCYLSAYQHENQTTVCSFPMWLFVC